MLRPPPNTKVFLFFCLVGQMMDAFTIYIYISIIDTYMHTCGSFHLQSRRCSALLKDDRTPFKREIIACVLVELGKTCPWV